MHRDQKQKHRCVDSWHQPLQPPIVEASRGHIGSDSEPDPYRLPAPVGVCGVDGHEAQDGECRRQDGLGPLGTPPPRTRRDHGKIAGSMADRWPRKYLMMSTPIGAASTSESSPRSTKIDIATYRAIDGLRV